MLIFLRNHAKSVNINSVKIEEEEESDWLLLPEIFHCNKLYRKMSTECYSFLNLKILIFNQLIIKFIEDIRLCTVKNIYITWFGRKKPVSHRTPIKSIYFAEIIYVSYEFIEKNVKITKIA